MPRSVPTTFFLKRKKNRNYVQVHTEQIKSEKETRINIFVASNSSSFRWLHKNNVRFFLLLFFALCLNDKQRPLTFDALVLVYVFGSAKRREDARAHPLSSNHRLINSVFFAFHFAFSQIAHKRQWEEKRRRSKKERRLKTHLTSCNCYCNEIFYTHNQQQQQHTKKWSIRFDTLFLLNSTSRRARFDNVPTWESKIKATSKAKTFTFSHYNNNSSRDFMCISSLVSRVTLFFSTASSPAAKSQ